MSVKSEQEVVLSQEQMLPQYHTHEHKDLKMTCLGWGSVVMYILWGHLFLICRAEPDKRIR
jgi:hypothetical protein